jgi:hypothetical protein
MITEEEKRAFARNEEKLWDMAALTVAPTILQLNEDELSCDIARLSYDVADALILERRKRLKSTGPETSGVG